MSREMEILTYLQKYPELQWTDDHCGNCNELDSCLPHFSQPQSSPENASKKCAGFRRASRCKICGARMIDYSESDEGYTNSYYKCPADESHYGWLRPFEYLPKREYR